MLKVADALSEFIDGLVQYGMNIDELQVVGHSLGGNNLNMFQSYKSDHQN